MRGRIAYVAALGLLAGWLAPTMARADLTLSLLPESATPIAAGQPAAIDLYLTGPRTVVVASIELTLNTLSGGAAYVAQAPNTDGFAEASTLNTYLSFTMDGSLLDNPSLGYAAAPGVDGIPVGSNNLLLGTLWVQTPANVTGNYPVNIVFSELLDSNTNDAPIPDETIGTTVFAIAPEPSLTALFLAMPLLFMRRRARRHEKHLA
jgi:hypothetical protein